MFNRRKRRRSLMALTGAGTGQRRVRVVRTTTVRDPGGDTVRVRRVRVFSFAVARVVRRVASERARPDLTGPLRLQEIKINKTTKSEKCIRKRSRVQPPRVAL